MSSAYEITALASARKDGLVAADVAALDYRGTATLAGAKVEANGNSPADFFYSVVRSNVAGILLAEENEAAEVATKTAAMAKLTVMEQEWMQRKLNAALLSDGMGVLN